MASIRYTKKHIKSLTEDLKDECLVFLAIHPEVTPKSIAEIIIGIENIAVELLFSLNHCRYIPAELTARQFINISVAEAEKKLNVLLEKLRTIVK